MHRSIMQNLDIDRCYLCGRRGMVEAHHCMHGTANRKLAEEDGLIVNLCPVCHRELHDRGTGDMELKTKAENAWLTYNCAHICEWVRRYGKNFI